MAREAGTVEEPPGDQAGPSGRAPGWADTSWAGTAGNWATPVTCRECGAESTEAAGACARCGAPLGLQPPVAAAPPTAGPGIPVPPMPWDPHYNWAPGQQPGPRSYRRQEALIAAGAVGVVLLLFVIAFLGVRTALRPAASGPAVSAPAATTPAASTPAASQLTWDQLQPGDCLAGSNMGLGAGTPWPDSVTQVACTQPHEAEVFYAGSIYPHTPAYPGEKAVDSQAVARCTASFATYDGASESESLFSFAYIVDDASADWSSGGNYVACVAFEPSSSDGPSGATPVNSSIKGSKL